MNSVRTQFNPGVNFEYGYEGELYTSNNLFPASASKNYNRKSGRSRL